MLRFSAEGLVLFLIPFLAYAALVALGSRVPLLQRVGAGRPVIVLAACGFGLVIFGLLALGAFSGRARGTYVPAHMEQGRLVPGRLE